MLHAMHKVQLETCNDSALLPGYYIDLRCVLLLKSDARIREISSIIVMHALKLTLTRLWRLRYSINTYAAATHKLM